jgi:hypothetical protein
LQKEKSAAVFAVRRANYTHRRKGVFNARSIEDLKVGGNVRYRTRDATGWSRGGHDRSNQSHKNTKLIRTYFNLCLTTLVVRNAYLYGNDLTLCGKIFDSSFI